VRLHRRLVLSFPLKNALVRESALLCRRAHRLLAGWAVSGQDAGKSHAVRYSCRDGMIRPAGGKGRAGQVC